MSKDRYRCTKMGIHEGGKGRRGRRVVKRARVGGHEGLDRKRGSLSDRVKGRKEEAAAFRDRAEGRSSRSRTAGKKERPAGNG